MNSTRATFPRTALALLAAPFVLALAGCGSNSGEGVLAGGAGSKWTVKDACKTLDKAEVAAAAGQPVTKAETTHNVASAAAAGTDVSTCAYTLANGGSLTLLTRVSDQDMSDAEIEQMRDAGGMMPRGEDVPGLGMKAFWTDQTHQVQVMADRKHYFNITYGPPFTLPGEPKPAPVDAKALTTGLAKKLL